MTLLTCQNQANFSQNLEESSFNNCQKTEMFFSAITVCVPCILLQVLDLKEQKKSGKKTSQELEKSRKENADLQTQLQQTQQQLEKVQGCILSVSPTRCHC